MKDHWGIWINPPWKCSLCGQYHQHNESHLQAFARMDRELKSVIVRADKQWSPYQ